MSDLFVIKEFRDYLIANGVVRNFGTTDNGLPQCILDPRDGAPLPDLGTAYSDAMVTLAKISSVPKRPLEEFLQEQIISIVVRAYKSPDAELIQRKIQDSIEGRKLFVMGQMTVEQVQAFQGDQPLYSDKFGYSRMQALRFYVRKPSLAGVPYWP